MVDYETEIKEGEILYFYQQLLPFGYSDIREALLNLKRYDIDIKTFCEYVDEYSNDTGINITELDICCLTYEYILNEVREIIEKETGTDIVNEFSIYAYSNYMCSTFDDTEETKEFIDEHKELLDNDIIKKFYEDI